MLAIKLIIHKLTLLPLGADQVEDCEPIFIDMPGWQENTFGIQEWDKLPIKCPKLFIET